MDQNTLQSAADAEEGVPPKPVRTRLHIVETLGGMLHGHDEIENISVTDLCHAAGISRTTFYQYFDNLTDVGVWMWDRIMTQTLYQVGITFDAHEGHLRKFCALREHRQFFEAALNRTAYDSVMQHAGRYMLTHFTETIARHRKAPLDDWERTRIRLFVVGAKYMTRDWAREGMQQEPEFMANVFVDSLPLFALPWLDPDETYSAQG